MAANERKIKRLAGSDYLGETELLALRKRLGVESDVKVGKEIQTESKCGSRFKKSLKQATQWLGRHRINK